MVLRIAHRGASGHAHENTLEAFQLAIEMGSDMIELDVRHSKDGIPIVFHDPRLHRKTNGKGKIKSTKFKDLRKFWQKNGERILTLREALAFINNRCAVNIELKTGYCQKVMDLIYEMGIEKSVIVSSFFKKPLLKIHKKYPKIRLGVLRKYVIPYRRAFRWCKEVNAYSFHPHYKNWQLSKVAVNKFHKQGIKVFVWTADEKKAIAKLKRIGVDGIMSNYPERV